MPDPFRLPAEYEPQSATWLTWLPNPETWPRNRPAAESAYASFIATLSRLQPVELICAAPLQPAARRHLLQAHADLTAIRFHNWPANDAWCRDHGPLFAFDPNQNPVILDLPYNAWGGKFPPWDLDDAIPARAADLLQLPRHRLPCFGEGGAIEINRLGTLITTESVWLNPNRNPGLTHAEAEAIFHQYFGVTRTVWLPQGMIGDDTDGHIDTLTRFVDDHTVLTVLPDATDPNFTVLHQNAERLREHFTVLPLPHPHPIRPDNWREDLLPATYANFLILNQAVLVPTYRQPDRDSAALHTLREAFPTRDILPIDCADIIWEGGALHCLSMQQPQFEPFTPASRP